MELSSFMFFLSSFIFVTLLLKLTTGIRTKSNKSIMKLPPGPRKIPLIGNLHLLVSSDPPHRVLRDLAVKYGALMHVQFGEIGIIVVSSSEVAKEFFKTHDLTFAYRPSILSAEIMTNGNTDLAFAPYGEYWRELRKICTLELLSSKRVQTFRSIREEEFLNLCRWIASKEGSSVNLTERVNLTTYDIITRASIGTKTTGEQAAFISIMKESIELGSGLYIGDLYPSIKLFRSNISTLRRKAEALHRQSDLILDKVISEHKTANDESKKHEDLIDVLLKFHVDARSQLALTTESIKSVLLDMFTAGSETSSTTIDWVMVELLKNPRVMKKVQEEVRHFYDKQGYVDESFLHELKYLKLVIKEGLRLHPPIPLLLPRENKLQQAEIDGYEIPINTRVLVNVWALGRDPKYWNEAESFVPERFLESSVDFKGNNFEYLPFGAGRRICPGIAFGLANVELPLAMLLYHFDWVLPHGIKPDELPMSETLGVVAARTNPLHAIPIIKIPLPEK